MEMVYKNEEHIKMGEHHQIDIFAMLNNIYDESLMIHIIRCVVLMNTIWRQNI